MRINFTRVEIHNFLSFADEVFQFPSSASLNLVCGKNNDIPGSKNGAGKTVLFQSLVFALFGQTKDNIKNEHVHNRYVKGKDVRVVLWFDTCNSKYKVASGFNNAGRPFCEFFQIENGVEIDKSKSSIAETRKFISDEVLHCDMSIFLRTILLSSDQNYNFFKLKKSDKKDFIEKLFDISMFKDMYDLMHKDILSIDKQLVSSQNKLLVLNKNNDLYSQQFASYDSAKKSKVVSARNEISQLEKQQEQLKSKNIKINETLVSKYNNASQILQDKLAICTSKTNQLNQQAQKVDVCIAALKTDIQHKQKALDKHKEIMTKLCNKCLVQFKNYYNIATYEDDISECQKKIALQQKSKDQILSKIKIQDDVVNSLQQKINIARQKLQQLTCEFNENSNRLAVIDQKLHDAQTRLASLNVEENPYTTLLEQNKIDLLTEKKHLDDVSTKYKHLKFAENIVSQDTIRKFIISDLIGLLNNKIRHYLSKFGANYYVVFNADMDYVFKTSNGECEYDNFSSGERARIMIATCFAFRDFMRIKNNLSSNILVLDEFIDAAIDSLAIESIIDVLKDFSKVHDQSIYVISHRKEAVLSDNFTSVIQVEKTNNLSHIAYS